MKKCVILFILSALLLALMIKHYSHKTETIAILKNGDKLPSFSSITLDNTTKKMTSNQFLGQPWILNVWASWCSTCVIEHTTLMHLADEGYTIIGLNYKDDINNAKIWLEEHGNPYQVSLVDADGIIAKQLSLYGVPETFFIDSEGLIHYRHIGPLLGKEFRQNIKKAFD